MTIPNRMGICEDPESSRWGKSEIPVQIRCIWCKGTRVEPDHPFVPCLTCYGTGYMTTYKSIREIHDDNR